VPELKSTEMRTNIPWDNIIKSFGKEATPYELAEIAEWLGEDEANQSVYDEIYNVYSVTSVLPRPINPDKVKAWEKIGRQISKRPLPAKQLFGKLKYAAAVIILLVGFASVWLVDNSRDNQIFRQYTEIVTPLGQKTMVVLPDSSLVWLNSGSSLKYKGNFNIKEREVTLEGEAFFKVKKDQSKKFRVRTGILNVDVYGTSFNIKNYKNDKFQEITVSEGKVGISDKTNEIRQLTRGEQAVLNKESKKIVFANNNPEVISAWKNNELIFDNTPLEEVIKYLERWYGVKIKIDTAMQGKHNFTFKIKTESFREMLEMMKVITPLDYEINGKEVTIRYAH